MLAHVEEDTIRQEVQTTLGQRRTQYDRIRREAINNLSDKAVGEIAKRAGIPVTTSSDYGLMPVNCCTMVYNR
jgi:hypothetical protein